jgi:hypothetical protein
MWIHNSNYEFEFTKIHFYMILGPANFEEWCLPKKNLGYKPATPTGGGGAEN